MMFGFVSYADAEPGFNPSNTGFLSQQRFNREDFRKLVKERFGVDWDSLSEEEQGNIFRRLRRQQRQNAGQRRQRGHGQRPLIFAKRPRFGENGTPSRSRRLGRDGVSPL